MGRSELGGVFGRGIAHRNQMDGCVIPTPEKGKWWRNNPRAIVRGQLKSAENREHIC